jgi:hypothetical protein
MKFVQNVGKNDAEYPVNPLVNGKREICPFYRTWVDMLTRCYNPRVKQKQPTYSNCTVCEEWLTFSKFKAWMELQRWQGMRLDKDLLYPGNTQYSPQTCVFVPNAINCIFGTCGASRGEYPIGVSKDKISKDMVNFLKKPFRAAVQTLSGTRKHLGMYATAMEAHAAWQLAKVEVIREYVLWWEFEPAVSQTFNIKIAENLLSVATNIEKDLQQRVETVRFYF